MSQFHLGKGTCAVFLSQALEIPRKSYFKYFRNSCIHSNGLLKLQWLFIIYESILKGKFQITVTCMLIAKGSFEDVVWSPLTGIWKRRGCPKKRSQVFPSVLSKYNTILLGAHGNKGSKEKEIQMP